jgi:hypothetical protein
MKLFTKLNVLLALTFTISTSVYSAPPAQDFSAEEEMSIELTNGKIEAVQTLSEELQVEESIENDLVEGKISATQISLEEERQLELKNKETEKKIKQLLKEEKTQKTALKIIKKSK